MTGFSFLPELFTIQCSINEPVEDAHVKPRLDVVVHQKYDWVPAELFTIHCTINEPVEDAHVKPRLEDSLSSFDRKDDHGESESIE
jgi:hypothetical protein